MELILSAADQAAWAGKSLVDPTLPQRDNDVLILRNTVASVSVAGISGLPRERLITVLNRGPYPVMFAANDTAAPTASRFSSSKILAAGKRAAVLRSDSGIAPHTGVRPGLLGLKGGLSSYYKLDEAASAAGIDAHGGIPLSGVVGTVGSVAGKVGNARDFAGTPLQILYQDFAWKYGVGNFDFSFACWIRGDTFPAGSPTVFGAWGGAGQRSYLLYVDTAAGNKLNFNVSVDGTNTTTLVGPVINVATWYFVVVWHDAVNDTLNMQINNGAPVSQAHTTGVYQLLSGNGSTFYVGYSVTGWDGQIDELGYWKRVLTTAERTSLYNSGNGLAYSAF